MPRVDDVITGIQEPHAHAGAQTDVQRDYGELLENLARLVPGVLYQYRLYPDGRSAFPWSSPGMDMIYEVTPEEVQHDATPVFGRLHPEDYDRVAEAIFESARTLQTFYCEFRVVLPRQGLRWRWSQAQPERTADGGTLWYGIIIDVTERVLAEAQNLKLQEQLQQAMKMEAVGRLAGGIAHDFNNLLTAIIGNTEFTAAELESPHAVREAFTEIRKAADSAAALTRQLLAFSRKQLIEPKVLDANELISSLQKNAVAAHRRGYRTEDEAEARTLRRKNRPWAIRTDSRQPGGERSRCHALWRHHAD